MALTTLIQTSQDGTTYTDLKTPSTYSISFEDMDSDSFRSVINGNLNRNRISPRWIKLSVTYSFLTSTETDTIARAVNTNSTFYIRMKSCAFGNTSSPAISGDTDWVSFKAYTSKFSCEMLEGQRGWNMSFNIIQAEGGTFQ